MENDIANKLDETENFTARNDYAFKKIFGTEENKDILTEFLSLATGIKITDFNDIRIENNKLSPQFYQNNFGVLRGIPPKSLFSFFGL
ncbi:MAG: PD-(D/E)XK nuclease family transposase [Treponema sp.]